MIVTCPCGHQLTGDLSKAESMVQIPGPYDEDDIFSFSVPSKSYIIDGTKLRVSPDALLDNSLIDVEFVDNSGQGCCSHDHLDIKCPSCNMLVGVGKLDCWQDKQIIIEPIVVLSTLTQYNL